MHGFVKTAIYSPYIRAGRPDYNAERLIDAYQTAEKAGAQLFLCAPLVLQGNQIASGAETSAYSRKVEAALAKVVAASGGVPIVLTADLPDNTVILLQNKKIVSLTKGEGFLFRAHATVFGAGSGFPVSLVFNRKPNFAGCPDQRGYYEYMSRMNKNIIFVLNPPYGGTTAEAVHSGQAMVFEDGINIFTSKSYCMEGFLEYQLIDTQKTRFRDVFQAQTNAAWVAEVGGNECPAAQATAVEPSGNECLALQASQGPFLGGALAGDTVRLPDFSGELPQKAFNPSPFAINFNPSQAYETLTAALVSRLVNTNIRRVVIGLSGGLDSCMTLLIALGAFEKQGWSVKDIQAISMPCFGTTDKTRRNAKGLAVACGVSMKTIDIKAAVESHLKDIGYGREDGVVYENAQARERAQILLDYANATNAMVLGTGDMSEAALGFCTYGGDTAGGYNTNIGLPKTVIRLMVDWYKKRTPKLQSVLDEILETPVSPELLPNQRTEEILGSYDIHDFFLYYYLRYGFDMEKLIVMAGNAFKGQYGGEQVEKAANVFFGRFFNGQWKRNTASEGAQVFEVGFSQSYGFKMPGDLFGDFY